MRLKRAFRTLSKLYTKRARRVRVGRTRAHIEIRVLGDQEHAAFERSVKQGFGELPRVVWVDVSRRLLRVIVAFEEDAFTEAELLRVVEEAERMTSITLAPFSDEAWEHPADDETWERLIVGIAGDALGAALGLTLRFSPLPASRLSGTAGALLAILQSSPKLRRSVDERLGSNRADLVLGTGSSLLNGLAQRSGSAIVELAQKGAQLAAVRARKRVFEQREAELFQSPSPGVTPPPRVEARPRPLPRGPIEEYTDRAWAVSLGGFALSMLTTRSVQRAVAALFGGLPKPARHGREAFVAYLEQRLAERNVLTVDREALRRLDRIDCLVIEGRLAQRDRFEVRRVVCEPGVDDAEAIGLVRELFDTARPLGAREHLGHVLLPLGLRELALGPELEAARAELGRGGELVLALMRAERVLALAEVEWIAQTGIEELIAAAREAEMRVVIASSDEILLAGTAIEDAISESEGVVRGVRRLQREGRGVCVVGTARNPALELADLGLGLMVAGEAVPWGAHVICGDDLSDVTFLIYAAIAARKVAKQSVNVSLGAATLGALVSAGGVLPESGRRVIAVVNAASLVSMVNGLRGGFTLARRALPEPRDRTPWYALDARGALHKLGTSEQGLSRREANERRPRAAAQRSLVGEFADAVTEELFNPLAPLLAAGAGLSAAVGSFGDAVMVGGVVALNAVVGGAQRFRTERSIRELNRAQRRRALVRRGGLHSEVDASELARGDVVVLAAGDVVPADCRILESEGLEMDASSMTGESLPVKKSAAPSFEQNVADRSSMLYEGTVVAAGKAVAVVVAAGDETEVRRGAVSQKRDASRGGVERRLRELIDLTGPVALSAGVGLIGAGLVRGRKLEDLVGSGVSLAVAAVPEGLPLLATAAQLAAASRLSKKGALVRNVRSIEALGRVDLICLDKTGTLTHGRLELDGISDGRSFVPSASFGEEQRHVLRVALRASGDAAGYVDPTDAALGRAATALGPDVVTTDYQKIEELPHVAGRGYHATLGQTSEGRLLSIKGAPELVLRFANSWKRGGESVPMDIATAAALTQHASDLGRLGYRLIAVAEKRALDSETLDLKAPTGLVFLGLLGFRDRVRESAAGAIRELATTGIRTVMISGDHASTSRAVAEEVGLLQDRGVMTGGEIAELTDEELDRRVEGIGVFARVTPSQKVRVVRALQRRGHVVAMVGDGANDAPAIRLANVGVAIGERSTAAAQASADIVLTDERIEALAQAVWEGRAMWASVRDAVAILVGGNLGEIGFTLGAGLIEGRPPLSARQLLLVNLLTDVAPAMAIALRPPALESLRELAEEGPERSLGKALNRDIAMRASVTALGAGAAWLTGRFLAGSEKARTIGLVALVGTQLGQTLLSGRFGGPVVATSLATGAILTAVVQTPGLSHAFGCRPLGPISWATALGASAAATAASMYFPSWVEAATRHLPLDFSKLAERPAASIKLESLRPFARKSEAPAPAGPESLRSSAFAGSALAPQ